MTSIEKLDSVLNYITTTTVWSDLRKYFLDIEREELRTILRKLRRDGYIDLLDDGVKLRAWDDEHGYSDKMVIQKNFEGFLFCQENGYQGKVTKEKAQDIRLENIETIQQNLARRLNNLTGWIAFGTVMLVIIEIVKFIYEMLYKTH